MVLITLVSKLFSSSMCVCWLCLNHSKIILGSSSFCGSTFSCPPTTLGCEAVVSIVAVVVGREYRRGRQGSDEVGGGGKTDDEKKTTTTMTANKEDPSPSDAGVGVVGKSPYPSSSTTTPTTATMTTTKEKGGAKSS